MFATADKIELNSKARHAQKTAARAARIVQDDAEDATSTIYEAANAIKEDVENLAENTGRRLRAVIEDAGSNVSEVTSNMTAAVREKPIQSSLIALGVGVVLGFMFRRS